MQRVVLDAATRAKFNGLDQVLELTDETGFVVGYYHPAPKGANPASGWGPFPAEEIEAAFDQADEGRPLEDILKGFKKR